MNLNLCMMEFRRQRLSFVIWTASLSVLVILGLAFYPMVMQKDFSAVVDMITRVPVMKGLMAAFNFDLSRIGNIASFYIIYNSIYVILAGCLYSIYTASRLLSREEEQKTAEFLFTRPISRMTIFFSKAAVYLALMIVLNAVIALSGIAGMELFKSEESLITWVSEPVKAKMAAAFRQNPSQFQEYFQLSEKDYILFYAGKMMSLFTGSMARQKDFKVDPRVMKELIDGMADDPFILLEKMRASPEEYGKKMKLSGRDYEDFLKGIKQAGFELEAMKKSLEADPSQYVEIFEMEPGRILDPFKTRQYTLSRILSRFGLDPGTRVFIYYRLDNYLILSLYIFLLMTCMGSIGLLLSVLLKRGKSTVGVCMGITIAFYFINSLSNIAPRTAGFGYISPFKFVNTDILDPAYGLDWWRVTYFAGLVIVLGGLSLFVLKKKDILV
ncbi:MAG: ABC transporter permease subunit [Spirochaetales bacterium]|nr:ABC transporter permease subunit [Spirochaetales bacterium]